MRLFTPRRGRPTKFGRPAQAVTITLPDDVVAALRSLEPDLSRAIVRLAELSGSKLKPRPPVELSHYGHSAVIVLETNKSLERLPGVQLVPLPDGRFLISLDEDTGVAEFEVQVRDTLAAGTTLPGERSALEALGDILREARRSRSVNIRQRNIIVLESRTASPHTKTGRGPTRSKER
jgi:hypothetical protein